MVMTRVIQQVKCCIQYNGLNIKEVFNFIDEHHGNANEITFEEFVKECRRPEDPVLSQKEGWLPNEEYHIYLNDCDGGDFCCMVSICKDDWLVETDNSVEILDDKSFKALYHDWEIHSW